MEKMDEVVKWVPAVGYFEGTDPMFLTSLAAEGVETVPIANTWDHHGKYVGDLAKGEVSVVVGYLHKIIPAEPVRTSLISVMLNGMFCSCKRHDIPILIVVPAALQNKAKAIIGDSEVNIRLVPPEELESHVRKYL